MVLYASVPEKKKTSFFFSFKGRRKEVFSVQAQQSTIKWTGSFFKQTMET